MQGLRAEREGPHALVGVGPRRIRPKHGHERRTDEQEPADHHAEARPARPSCRTSPPGRTTTSTSAHTRNPLHGSRKHQDTRPHQAAFDQAAQQPPRGGATHASAAHHNEGRSTGRRTVTPRLGVSGTPVAVGNPPTRRARRCRKNSTIHWCPGAAKPLRAGSAPTTSPGPRTAARIGQHPARAMHQTRGRGGSSETAPEHHIKAPLQPHYLSEEVLTVVHSSPLGIDELRDRERLRRGPRRHHLVRIQCRGHLTGDHPESRWPRPARLAAGC